MIIVACYAYARLELYHCSQQLQKHIFYPLLPSVPYVTRSAKILILI